jgi:hypothetical protein
MARKSFAPRFWHDAIRFFVVASLQAGFFSPSIQTERRKEDTGHYKMASRHNGSSKRLPLPTLSFANSCAKSCAMAATFHPGPCF